MRGFRWQLLALVFAAVTFGVVLWTRPQPTLPPPSPTATVPAENTTIAVTPESSATPLLPTSTPNQITESNTVPAVVTDVPTFREALVGDVSRLNPLLRGTNDAQDAITSLIFEGLVRTNQYGEPIPALASEWVIANDRIEYVFRLRQDILWQDGTPFTSRDVAFTMDLLRDPHFPGDPQVGEFWQTVETEVLGDYLIRFRLTQPLGSFLDAMRIGILPEHVLRGTSAADLPTHPFNLSPVGTGPYQLEAIRTMDDNQISVIDLRVAPTYQLRPEGQRGYAVERMRFQVYNNFDEALAAFDAGEVDGLTTPSSENRPTLLSNVDTQVYTKLEPILGVLIFNWRRTEPPENADTETAINPFREERVRNALALSLDRRVIIERNLLNRAVPANNPLLPGMWAYAADIVFPTVNLARASELLENANLDTGSEDEAAPLLTFTILTPNRPEQVNLAQEIANQWGALRVEATIEAVDEATYQERLQSGDFDTVLVELSLGRSADPDVYSFWHQGQFPDGNNYGAVDDRRISETLERARRDPFGVNRVEHYAQFQQAFVDRAVAIPLYYPLYTYTVSDRVDGVQLGFVGEPADRFRNLRDWKLNDE
jgi:peptide/nickel transport system substrate-binding protein